MLGRNGVRNILIISMIFSSVALAGTPDAARQQQLLRLLKQDCGSCHGMTLKGGLGPDIRAQRMSKLSCDAIVTTIAKGRPGTPMPPWEKLLSADDIEWLAQQLQLGVE